MNEAEIWTVDEVAAYLKCHPSTISRLLKRKEIPGMKLGAQWRFRRESLEKWMCEREGKQ